MLHAKLLWRQTLETLPLTVSRKNYILSSSYSLLGTEQQSAYIDLCDLIQRKMGERKEGSTIFTLLDQ
jgi:hypothetical protein